MENDENDYNEIINETKKIINITINNKSYFASIKPYGNAEFFGIAINGKTPELREKYFIITQMTLFLNNYCQKWVDNIISSKASFVNDVLQYSLNGINFREIAEYYIDEVKKEMEVV